MLQCRQEFKENEGGDMLDVFARVSGCYYDRWGHLTCGSEDVGAVLAALAVFFFVFIFMTLLFYIPWVIV